MPTPIRSALAAGLALLAAAGATAAADTAAADAVHVTYVKPASFADLPTEPRERERVLRALSEHFVALGRRLPAGQQMDIEVLDIDLAGRELPLRRAAGEIRVLNGGADWPRLRLRYTLRAGADTVASGEGELADMSYQQGHNRYPAGDTLRYEKQMVDDWFARQFLPVAAGR